MEDDAIRVAVGLRLGASMCELYQCTCGNMVNTTGNNGLSFKRSAGRTLRHNYLNDLIYRALLQAELPSTKEPARLLRTVSKQLDGLTNVPWQADNLAVWDVTVADTLADSYLVYTSRTAAAAAELAATRKETKYIELSTAHHFVSLAFELLGSIGSKATNLFKRTLSSLNARNGQPFGNCMSVPAPACSIAALYCKMRSRLFL